MKHHITKIAAIACIIFLSSCSTTRTLMIDVLQPASINYADNIVNVGIVDNAGATLDEETTAQTDIEKLHISKSKEVFLHSLAQFMNEEKYFNEVKTYDHPLRTDKEYGQQVLISKNTIQTIAQEMNVDALVVLNTFDLNERNIMYSFEGLVLRSEMTNATLMLRLFDANGNALTPHMATMDSVITFGAQRPNETFDALQHLSLQLAETTTKNLLPYWETQERIYYTDGTKLMKTADSFAKANKWTEAAKTWGAAFEGQEDFKQKAKIAANIALANENLGDIPNAVEWIRIASNMLEGDKKSDEALYINWYKIKLLEREKNNPKVLEQMGLEEVKEE